MNIKEITAKFNSVCCVTGERIRKGDKMYYDYSAKKCYSVNGLASIHNDKVSDDERSVANMIQANEDAYFDNFCYNNGI